MLKPDFDGADSSNYIRGLIAGDAPCLICRFGSGELSATSIHHFHQQSGGLFRKSVRFIRGEIGTFLWDRSIRRGMRQNAGFFPATDDQLNQFGRHMIESMPYIDVLGSWRTQEKIFRGNFPTAKIVPLRDMEPYSHERPWSEALEGQKVLVIHPFKTTIEHQYARREGLFKDSRVLPQFDLQVIRAVQSAANEPTRYRNWFEALDSMCEQIRQTDFDVAIIGAGAYGMPLARYVKQIGKKAIHMGGTTQVLFGIKGRRWDNRNLYNDNWVRPSNEETPTDATCVEGGCYW